ncbi:MAG: L,D-transpeptidase [Myxococcales bacterium]|nr:L,D-transpeptidase [Myxococcales bacterium]
MIPPSTAWSSRVRRVLFGALMSGCWVAIAAAQERPRPSTLEARLLAQGALPPQPTHIYSKGYATFVYPQPSKGTTQIGYIRVGHGVRLRSGSSPRMGPGCAGGFYAVEPRGYVCLDRSATLDPTGRYTSAMSGLVPSDDASPYHFALSNGTPMYRRLPTREEWTKAERFLGAPGTHAPLSWGNKGHEVLAQDALPAVDGALPWFLEQGGSAGSSKPLGLVRRQIPLGSMLAYVRVFEHAGRRWLLSADGTVVPADRTRTFRESSFEGIELDAQTQLPLGWFREGAAAQYRQVGEKLVKASRSWQRLGHVRLDAGAEPRSFAGESYLLTLERDEQGPLWVREADIARVDAREKLPWGITDQDKWLWMSISRGTLVAYQGERPLFATLVSPGVGGVPVKGRDPVKYSTTPMGIYRITYKHRAATMSPEQGEDRSFWIADVPYTQYFNAPFALHVAYWHDTFGKGMSAGCVNLSPRDGKRLFGFTEPEVPEDWNGAAAGGVNGKGTFVVIER